jgi:VWFA-related protein
MRIKALLFCAAVAFAAAAQQSPAPFLDTYEVRVSNLDVIVTDRAGKPVTGLAPASFEVRENGVLQTITNFSAYDVSAGTAEEKERLAATSATPQAPPPRRFVFLVDELSLHPQTRGKLFESAMHTVDTMRREDLASVVTVATANKIALDFTSDKEAIRKTLRSAFDQGGFRTNTASKRERYFYETQVGKTRDSREHREMARLYAAQVAERVRGTLSAMRALIATLAPQSGRKILVVLTESLASKPGEEAFTVGETLAQQTAPAPMADFATPGEAPIPVNDAMGKELWFDARPMIREVGALAMAGGIAIYSIQPDPGFHPALGGGADQAGSFARSNSSIAISSFDRAITDNTHETLMTLAEQTGGKFYAGDGQFEDAFRQIASDAGSYYSIGYRPSTTSNAAHTIDVRVRDHPEYQVRFGRSLMRENATQQMNDLVAASLMYPKDVDELGVKVTAPRPIREGKQFKVTVAVAIPIASLTFVPSGDKQRAQFSVHYAATGEDVAFHTGFDREQGLEVANADLADAKTHAFTYTTTLVVNRGKTTIAVAVEDPVSRKASFKTVTVDAR